MDLSLLKQFIAETFFDQEGMDQLLELSKFIDLSKDEQILKIKEWASDKEATLNEEKSKLDAIKAQRTSEIDAELAKIEPLK